MCDALKKMSTENRKLYDKMVKQKSKRNERFESG